MLNLFYVVLTTACIVLQPLCYLSKRDMVVSSKAESALTTAHELVKWLRHIVSLLRQVVG